MIVRSADFSRHGERGHPAATAGHNTTGVVLCRETARALPEPGPPTSVDRLRTDRRRPLLDETDPCAQNNAYRSLPLRPTEVGRPCRLKPALRSRALRSQYAFTLIEVLVAIGIFLTVSVIMLGALFGATEAYRLGESARQSGDEATVVIAALQEDLTRAVPVRLRDGQPAGEWGRVIAAITDAAGNCELSLVVENSDHAQVRWVGATVVGVRKRVRWYINRVVVSDPAQDELLREVVELGDTGAPAGLVTTSVMTRGCLHFGVWADLAQAHRPVTAGSDGPLVNWESSNVLPYADDPGTAPNDPMPLDTSVQVPDATSTLVWPLPDALRVSLILTGGGRHALRGTVVRADAGGVRIAGIRALPTVSGSLLRIGDEWVRYDDFRKHQLTGVLTAQLRSTAHTISTQETALAGQFFSIVVALPR